MSQIKSKTPKYTKKSLLTRINKILSTRELPLTYHQLIVDLDLTYPEVMLLENSDPVLGPILLRAKDWCFNSIIDAGFRDDRSFARWYLDRYNKETPGSLDSLNQDTDSKTNVTINILPDQKDGYTLDDFVSHDGSIGD